MPDAPGARVTMDGMSRGRQLGNGNLVPDLWLSEALTDRIELSTGVRVLEDEDARQTGYVSNSVIPIGPWKDPDSAARAWLFGISHNRCPGSRGIGIGAVSGALRQAVECVRALNLTCQADADRYMMSSGFTLLSKLFSTFLRAQSFHPAPSPEILGVSVMPPGLLTATIDRNKGLKIGLHLDSWDKREYGARDLSRNRICINLGEEDRYFLFCNVSVTTIVMGLNHGDQRYISSGALVKRFFDKFPKYPILRMRLAPGEFYIAPTENIIHDATTMGKEKYDVALTALGYFRL
jgi:hypothetical protein